ncbi:S-layer homology domain-containing protein [Muriventricola aceti]|uniref:S-layer homology domain-containing protein n=1 Tax=Muriventricola aceti TaxID=2981773 RepID=UPI000822C1EA|nr:S-layer homology domain-containing protein [Muriventricola aceti]MCU6703245.1 S-layer homology domain-containing protein [Muriventricola aceti]SCJ41073.1 S-layer protein [uncultured Flavonifractor sp.]
MRNLKRALSLALASVMVMGLMVVGTGAAYDDVSSKQNQEAIEVLQEVGVMTGDENGNFNPDALVTRNEMAVVMSNLMDYRVANYKGTSPFTDVPAWAEPYVAACYTNGITSGVSATTYGGDQSVTTAQAALMLMKALGYFQFQSDFENDWQFSTIKQANKIDLFIDVESGVIEPMTRNDLAQLVLNTLKAGTVEADNDTIKVDADGVKVEAGKVSYNFITSGESYAGAIKGLTTAGTVVNSGTRIVELGEKLYQGDLKMYEDRSDDFGRPGTRWTYKTTTIGTYSDTPAATYTAKMSKDDLYDLLGKDVVDDYRLDLFVDGVKVADEVAITTTYAQANSSSASCQSGKGVLTEVYTDADKELVTVTVSNTYLMQATGDYNESKGTVAVTTLTTPIGGLTNSVNSLADDDFDSVKDMAEDDYILYTYAGGKVQSAVKAEVLTGEVTAYSTATKTYGDAGGNVTIDGTKHDYAKFAEVDGDNGCATEFSVGNNAAIVLDQYGYALYVDDASLSMGNYVYINGIAKETNLSTKDISDAYFSDGANETITIKELRNAAGQKQTITYASGNRTDSYNGWYSYSRNSKDEYTLTAAATTGTSSATSIKNNKVVIFDSVVGNSNTVFIVKDKNDDITIYTGIVNVPDITIDTANDGKIAFMRDKDNNTKAASLVFVDTGDNGRVKSTTNSLLYTVKKDTTFVDNSDNEKVERWFVVLDGELTKVETKERWSKGNLYEDYSIDADGYYETGSAFDTPDDADKETVALNGDAITQSGDTLTLDTTSLVIGSDSEITLIMLPANKGDRYPLSGEVMNDNNADYQVEQNIAAKTLANTFKDRTVTGNAYVIYDDKNDSDLAARIYVVVTECSTVNGGSVTPPVTGYAISNTNSGAVSVTMDKNKVTIANVKVVDSNGANYNYGSATLNFKIEVRDGGYQEEVSFTAPAATANQSEYAGCMIDGDFTLPYELAAGNYRVTVTVSNNTIGTLTIGVGTATVA